MRRLPLPCAAPGLDDQPSDFRATGRSLALPPGRYDVHWVQDYDRGGAPIRLAAGLAVSAGERTTVTADAGVALAVARWVPPLDETYGWWGAVPAGGFVMLVGDESRSFGGNEPIEAFRAVLDPLLAQ